MVQPPYLVQLDSVNSDVELGHYVEVNGTRMPAGILLNGVRPFTQTETTFRYITPYINLRGFITHNIPGDNRKLYMATNPGSLGKVYILVEPTSTAHEIENSDRGSFSGGSRHRSRTHRKKNRKKSKYNRYK